MMNPQEPLILFIGAIVLGLTIAWAVYRNKSRNRANDRIGEAAARDQYQHPNSYNPEEYRAELRPKT